METFKIPTGIPPIDEVWGGFFRGGTYLLYGKAILRRTLLALQFTRTGIERNEPALFISPMRPKDLMIEAASIGFNLKQAYDEKKVRLFRIPPALNLNQNADGKLANALNDVIKIIKKYEPDRLIIDDFTPFARFKAFEHFKASFTQLLEQLSLLDTTTLLGLREPASERAQQVIDFIAEQVTGTIHLEEDEEHPGSTWRKLTLIPNIGHLQSPITVRWDLSEIIEEVPLYAGKHISAGETPPPVRTITGKPKPSTTETSSSEESLLSEQPHAALSTAKPPTVSPRSFSAPEVPKSPPPSSQETPLYTPVENQSSTHPCSSPASSAPATVHIQPIPLGKREEAAFTASKKPSTEKPPTSATLRPESPTFSYIEEEIESPPPDENALHVFKQHLEEAFRQRGNYPFMLVALRANHAYEGFDFPLLVKVVESILRKQDEVYIDWEKQRIIIFMPYSTPTDVRQFFHQLSLTLRKESPEQGDLFVRSVASLVAPNGEPFPNAAEFLEFVLQAK